MSRLQRIRDKAGELARQADVWAARAAAILEAQNGPAREFVADDHKRQGVICPRRSGKSFSCTSKALYYGETKPNSRILIVSLTLKSTIENYWSSAPGGIHIQNAKFDLHLKFNNTRFEWFHENGSHGQLVGAETRADLEKIRGALAEADLIIVDECKSFAPELLETLIRDVLEPGLMTRGGTLVLAGTPGSIPLGKFYEATSLNARIKVIEWDDEQKKEVEREYPTCFPFRERTTDKWSAADQDELWCLHAWTIRDNRKQNPNDPDAAWRYALKIKARNKWADDHPTWRREYLGEWVIDSLELVYTYATYRDRCKWEPPRWSKENPSGLDPAEGPWHLIMGLDFGFRDDCAIVMAAWSETRQELRVIDEYKEPGLLPDEMAHHILRIIDKRGVPEVIVGDRGGMGITYVETINQRYGLSIIPAEKREKQDFQDLLNSDFCAGRVKIYQPSDLHNELCGLQWDLSKESKVMLARQGKLKEDPSCPNHLCDALLYLWRYAYHYWAVPEAIVPERGTEEWVKQEMDRQVAAAAAKKNAAKLDPHGIYRETLNDRMVGEDAPVKWTRM